MSPAQEMALLEKYAPLVTRIALGFARKSPPSVTLADIRQSGMIGLWKAIRRYRRQQGVRFETYAAIRIKGEILDEARRHYFFTAPLIRLEVAHLEHLPACSGQDWEEREALLEAVAQAMAGLAHRKQAILRGYYQAGLSLTEIAQSMGLSLCRTSQLKGQALAQIGRRIATQQKLEDRHAKKNQPRTPRSPLAGAEGQGPH